MFEFPHIFLYIKLDFCMLNVDIMEMKNIAQGKVSIPGVDDGDELVGTDVRIHSSE